MTETLQEFCDSRGVGLRVDRQAGLIRGVKILGPRSRNGRDYPPATLQQAAALYEDAKVNVNHPKGDPGRPRDYQDRIGTIRGVAVRGDEGLFADFHFNPKHALAEQLLWDAEHAPENVGFSHNVEARTARRGDRVVVEAITRVQSVDLVADPATTRGLFESQAEDPQAEIQRLRAEVERLTIQEAARQKEQTVRRLLREFQLPEPEATDPRDRAITSRPFVETLLAADGEPAMRQLVEERARLVRTLGGDASRRNASDNRPVSCDQHFVDGLAPLDAKKFVEVIT
jgi:hypothetical protein